MRVKLVCAAEEKRRCVLQKRRPGKFPPAVPSSSLPPLPKAITSFQSISFYKVL
jgi:hypothetical protein